MLAWRLHECSWLRTCQELEAVEGCDILTKNYRISCKFLQLVHLHCRHACLSCMNTMPFPTFHSRTLLSQMHRTSHRVWGQVIDYHFALLSQRGYATSVCHLRLPHCTPADTFEDKTYHHQISQHRGERRRGHLVRCYFHLKFSMTDGQWRRRKEACLTCLSLTVFSKK